MLDSQDIRGLREGLAHMWLVAVGPRRDARYGELVLPGFGNILEYLGEMYNMSVGRMNGEIDGWEEQSVTKRFIILKQPVWQLVEAEKDENWWIKERKRLLRDEARKRQER